MVALGGVEDRMPGGARNRILASALYNRRVRHKVPQNEWLSRAVLDYLKAGELSCLYVS